MPRWRAVLGVYFQGTVVALSAAANYCLPASSATVRYPPRIRFVSQLFFTVFATFMMYDFAILTLPTEYVAHHGVSLACHGYVAVLGTAAAFPWYVRGVGCLEAGSAMCNLSFLFEEDSRVATAYAACMTLSNAGAVYAMRHWVHATAAHAGKALGAIVTLALVVGRQRVAIEVVRCHSSAE